MRKIMSLKIGKKAPNFKISVDKDNEIKLSDFIGKNVIIYFYPKDDTPGCTKEACNFRDKLPSFKKTNAIIIGISKDSLSKHDKFKTKYKLNFMLGSDENSNVCEKYEVWKEKNMYGKKYMGIERSTFLIDKTGILRNEWRKVKVPGHVENVLLAIKEL